MAANLAYGRRRTDAPPVIGFDAAVDLLDLGALLRQMPATLSGGERQRVAIGRALLSNPAVLLMDEPVSALDGHRRQEVLSFIAELKAALSIPILFVSHRLEDILKIADDVVLMDAGQVVDHAPLVKIAPYRFSARPRRRGGQRRARRAGGSARAGRRLDGFGGRWRPIAGAAAERAARHAGAGPGARRGCGGGPADAA